MSHSNASTTPSSTTTPSVTSTKSKEVDSVTKKEGASINLSSYLPSSIYSTFIEFSDNQRITRLQNNCQNDLYYHYQKQCMNNNDATTTTKKKKKKNKNKEECLDLLHSVWSCRAVALGCGHDLNILNVCRSKDKKNCGEYEKNVGDCVKLSYNELEKRIEERKQKQEES